MKRLAFAWIALGFSWCAFGISGIALLGYFLRVSSLYNWNATAGTIAMALPTAVAIFALSIAGILLASSILEPHVLSTPTPRPAGPAGHIDYRTLAAVMIVCLLIICGGAWYQATKAVSAANRERHLAVIERAQAAHEYAEAVTIRNQAKLAALNQRRYFANSWTRWGHVRTFVMAFVPGGES